MPKFRHLRIRSFKVSEFEFVNHMLQIEPGESLERFRSITNHPNFPAMHRHSIVEYPDDSDAYQPKPLSNDAGKVVRNEMVTTDVKSQATEQPAKPDDGKAVSRESLMSSALKGSK